MGDKPLVASVIWDRRSQVHQIQGQVIEDLGYLHQFFMIDEAIPVGAKYIFIQGPYGTYVPMVEKLLSMPEDERPTIVYWFQQNLMLVKPDWLLMSLAAWFSDLSWLSSSPQHQQRREKILPFFRGRGSRFASLGDILWLKKQKLLGVLGVSATYYADYFKKCGIEALVVPRGHHPSYGKLLNLERDITVTWMGKIRNRRREKVIYGLKDALEQRGLTMHIHDNVSLPFIFGEERTHILNRSWFVVNVLAYPTDEISIRFYIAAANGAVVLTEPGINKYPFENGVHMVSCKTSEMADKVEYFLNHPPEWQTISNRMYEKVSQELTIERSLELMMNTAEKAAASAK